MAKKTRFVIQADDQISELFSVREMANGDLIILQKKPRELGFTVLDQYDAVEEMRISVHVSPGSPGHTFVHHVRFGNGSYRRIYAYVARRNGRLLWPLFASACADLSATHYKSKPAGNDRLISLGTYSPRFSVLVYFVVVTSPEFWNRPPFGLNGITAKFKQFDVHVYWGYMAASSFHQGEHFQFATGSTVENNEKHEVVRFMEHGSCSCTRGSLIETVREVLLRMINAHLFKLQRFLESDGITFSDEDWQLMRQVLKSPLQPDQG